MRSESMPGRPAFSVEEANAILRRDWNVEGVLTALPSHSDQNFRVRVTDGPGFVLRFANAEQSDAFPEALVRLLDHVQELDLGTQVVVPGVDGRRMRKVPGAQGALHHVMMTEWIEGRTLASEPHRTPSTLRGLGRFLARLDTAIEHFDAPGLHRRLDWDLLRGGEVIRAVQGRLGPAAWPTDEDRSLFEAAVAHHMALYEPLLQLLPRATVHNDPNDHNLLISAVDGTSGSPEVVGILDFGDAVHSVRVADVVIGATYAILGSPTPVFDVREVVRGYTEGRTLSALEAHLLLPLIRLRLLVSVAKSAEAVAAEPNNAYLSVSQAGAWQALRQLSSIDFDAATVQIMGAVEDPEGPEATPVGAASLAERRARQLGPSLSLSYDAPLTIVRGWKQYLFDDEGSAYLDCVNNVCHVGHSHPHVVRSIAQQARALNTNSRYLHPARLAYVERLLETLPSELDTCFLVSSGSEANELALRIAKASTSRDQVVVLESGYHGSTSALAELSPYKFAGPGGGGRPAHVHVAPLPDVFRGTCRNPSIATQEYLRGVEQALERAAGQGGAAAFFAEPLPSCGGQIMPPAGYLKGAFEAARARGAVAIADEVQTGFGRVGSAFWAFELDGAQPDVVTMGKPMGNGHPLGAVVTRRELAESFANGMEYFATFGGNPVSCAAGAAVLDVIRDEGLQANALRVGTLLLDALRSLAQTDPRIGDVRGRGLFIGIEFVVPGSEREPDAELAHRVVQFAKEAGVLLSTDGPAHNVIKIKPPLVFTTDNVDTVVRVLGQALVG